MSEEKTYRDVPIDWEAVEDAFENNAPEVHSYLHLVTGDVVRLVDGIADPAMRSRISSDTGYLRIEPVNSREQYRWMERFIPLVEDPDMAVKLQQAIDGKGAFRRFKDVLMSHTVERERWFTFRTERLRVFIEAWLDTQSIKSVERKAPPVVPPPESTGFLSSGPVSEPQSRRGRTPEMMRRSIKEISDALTPRDLDTLNAFAEFLRARSMARPAPPSIREMSFQDDGRG